MLYCILTLPKKQMTLSHAAPPRIPFKGVLLSALLYPDTPKKQMTLSHAVPPHISFKGVLLLLYYVLLPGRFFAIALRGIPAEGGVLLFEGNVRPSVLARSKRSASSLVPL